jgi:hypothetical protein
MLVSFITALLIIKMQKYGIENQLFYNARMNQIFWFPQSIPTHFNYENLKEMLTQVPSCAYSNEITHAFWSEISNELTQYFDPFIPSLLLRAGIEANPGPPKKFRPDYSAKGRKRRLEEMARDAARGPLGGDDLFGDIGVPDAPLPGSLFAREFPIPLPRSAAPMFPDIEVVSSSTESSVGTPGMPPPPVAQSPQPLPPPPKPERPPPGDKARDKENEEFASVPPALRVPGKFMTMSWVSDVNELDVLPSRIIDPSLLAFAMNTGPVAGCHPGPGAPHWFVEMTCAFSACCFILAYVYASELALAGIAIASLGAIRFAQLGSAKIHHDRLQHHARKTIRPRSKFDGMMILGNGDNRTTDERDRFEKGCVIHKMVVDVDPNSVPPLDDERNAHSRLVALAAMRAEVFITITSVVVNPNMHGEPYAERETYRGKIDLRSAMDSYQHTLGDARRDVAHSLVNLSKHVSTNKHEFDQRQAAHCYWLYAALTCSALSSNPGVMRLNDAVTATAHS